ncbi:hypothetical protein MNB_SV-15-60 [hydrothermal vent metagenome]|uniref:Uncharacterized protein n=1 Tax=hydrothermal vent metagenome TaxID=652676 RepID=A0A1W1EJF5_9ZZZZ
MNIEEYKFEIILASSFLLMIMTFIYKSTSYATMQTSTIERRVDNQEISRVIALKELWGDKKLTKKVDSIKQGIAQTKIKEFRNSSKKLRALFQDLSINELNRVVKKVTNLAISIVKFNIKNSNGKYRVELRCKW